MPDAMIMRLRHRLIGSLAGLGLLAVLGCGGDGLPRRYPVSGRVTYQGKPVPKGEVTFSPTRDNGRTAAGNIQGDGSYRLTTMNPGDGALPGRYRVSVTAVAVDFSEVETTKGGPPLSEEAEEILPRIHYAPSRYENPDTSGLTAEVKPQSNTINFVLRD